MYKGITKDSREVKEGYIYACFEGGKVSGYDFIENAKINGAIKIIGEKDLYIDMYEKVNDINIAMATYSQEIFNNPQDKLDIIGITGTDGKTSIAILVDELLNKLSTSSYLGTNGFFIKSKEYEYNGFTTPFADKLYDYLRQSVDKESKYFVMEVSSHALKQKRVAGLKYSVGIFSNLTKEHLDFHGNMEDYFLSKKKLFEQMDENSPKIINVDDEYGKKLTTEFSGVLSVSKKDKGADFYIFEEKLGLGGTNFKLYIKSLNKTFEIDSPLLADFNIYNLVQAIACVMSLGYDIESILKYVGEVKVLGRLEKVENELGLNIIIDFAHTADAILKVMGFVNKNTKEGKVHVLTGSAGERDSQKRPLMGENAAKYADYLYLTEDDPRSESVSNIINDLKMGIKNQDCSIIEEVDRKKAINKMINNASLGDTLVLFGKGEMKVMYYDGYTEDYFEKDVVLEKLRKNDDNN